MTAWLRLRRLFKLAQLSEECPESLWWLPGEMTSERKMTVQVPDRFKVPNALWVGLAKIGLTPAAVLRQARVPATVFDGEKSLVTTAQFFALWRAAGELSSDPAAGLKLATQIDVGNRHRRVW